LETAVHKTISRTTTAQPAATRSGQGATVAASAPAGVSTSLQISSPKDAAETAAETTARRVAGMAAPSSFSSPYLMRFASSGIFAQKTEPGAQRVFRQEQGPPTVTPNIGAEIRTGASEGSPLPLGVRQFMEPRFNADFSGVKIHTGDKAARLNRQLSANAFAVGNNIYFGKDKFQPESHAGRELIAHELTHTLQQGAVLRRRTVDVAGKTMFVASDGKLIELPPDMTDAEATRLEIQAKAAEQRLGKGPPPKPVPDVKKLVRKEEKKGKPKLEAKGKKGAGKGSKTAPKGGGAVPILKVRAGKVAQYLAAKATPVLAKGVAVLRKLKQNEQTHDDAAEKLQQTEKAVVIPPSEGQSKSNTGQVTTVDSYPPPVVDEKKAKQPADSDRSGVAGDARQKERSNLRRQCEGGAGRQERRDRHLRADGADAPSCSSRAYTRSFAAGRNGARHRQPEPGSRRRRTAAKGAYGCDRLHQGG